MTDDRAFGADDVASRLYTAERLRKLRFLMTDNTDLAGSAQLGLLHRYETRLHRMYQRAVRNFLLLRECSLPNEPNPNFGHSAPETCPKAL